MDFKSYLESDLAVFLNTEEFAYTVEYHVGTDPVVEVEVQFFDEESDLGDSMMRKLVARVSDVPTISKNGFFMVEGDKYGIIDFRPDEENLILQVLLQKAML